VAVVRRLLEVLGDVVHSDLWRRMWTMDGDVIVRGETASPRDEQERCGFMVDGVSKSSGVGGAIKRTLSKEFAGSAISSSRTTYENQEKRVAPQCSCKGFSCVVDPASVEAVRLRPKSMLV